MCVFVSALQTDTVVSGRVCVCARALIAREGWQRHREAEVVWKKGGREQGTMIKENLGRH